MHDADYCCLPLYGRNGLRGYTLIDAADRPIASAYRWGLNSNGYAAKNYWDGGHVRAILLHRLLLELPYGDKRQGDHINRDKLDNRRGNLRIANQAENKQNVGAQRRGRSRFRGVMWEADRRRWRARVGINGRSISVGTFESEIDAARAAEAYRFAHMPFAEPDAELRLLDGA